MTGLSRLAAAVALAELIRDNAETLEAGWPEITRYVDVILDAEADAGPVHEWAIVELMGHVRVAGRVSEEKHFGATLGRIDIPTGPDAFATQFFGGSSIYRLTPVDETIARSVAAAERPTPVHRWELPISAMNDEADVVVDDDYPEPF